jgi:hypothetical protein
MGASERAVANAQRELQRIGPALPTTRPQQWLGMDGLVAIGAMLLAVLEGIIYWGMAVESAAVAGAGAPASVARQGRSFFAALVARVRGLGEPAPAHDLSIEGAVQTQTQPSEPQDVGVSQPASAAPAQPAGVISIADVKFNAALSGRPLLDELVKSGVVSMSDITSKHASRPRPNYSGPKDPVAAAKKRLATIAARAAAQDVPQAA